MNLNLSNKRRLYVLILVYAIALGISYALPIGLTDSEWYSFYSYLDSHGATPYVDVREGYPPIGFLIYMPLYCAFQNNPAAFSYAFRAVNAALLVATLFVLYQTSKTVVGEKKGLKIALYYAVLPSVVIANAYSNDIVALLPAVLGIYMMQQKKATLCGLLLGIATLSKGFPALLIIPALFAFTDNRDKVKVVGTMVITLVFVSLPFMVVNPFTYVSTFIHHGSRGPWETIWALFESYHSHGGLLHPYFDKFFYHFNLLSIYPANSYDHAIYSWNLSSLPNLLTLCQIGIVALLSLTYKNVKNMYVSLSGLLYISYMFFFQGYSTQFSVSTPLYLLLATINCPLIFLIPLEISHIIQMLSWYSQIFGPEFLRDAHLPLLIFAVILRTIVFAALIVTSLKSRCSFKQVTGLFKRCFSYLNLFKDKLLVLALSAIVILALMSSIELCNYLDDSESFRSFDGYLKVSQSEWQGITVNGLKTGDQVIVRLVTNTGLDAKLDNSSVQLESGVRNQFNLGGSFNETYLFFVADSESHALTFKMQHPKIPFKITDGLYGDLNSTITLDGTSFVFNLRDNGADGQGSMFRLAYPCSVFVDDNFRLNLNYTVAEGEVSNVLLDVFDNTDEWLYTFVATENFVLQSDSIDLYGCSNLDNDKISLVALIVSLDDDAYATVKLDELSITSDETCDINFYAEPEEELFYQVFIERDFTPSLSYVIFLISAVALGVIVASLICRKLKPIQVDGMK
ncbi:MAG: DUF2029 domain-containing protein [Candidatus Bathyarchaeota archaeon]|nr:DUF2029 domain-containing protein [Candidatus Bathyarchaeum sp.]